MKPTVVNDTNFPYLIVDDWYTEEELNRVLIELKSLSTTAMVRTEDGHGSPGKAKQFRIFPQKIYSDYGLQYSPIFSCLKKQQQQEFHDLVHKTFENTKTALSLQFVSTNTTDTIINYYEQGDEYNTHFDIFQFTMIIMMYQTPKSFTGGELVLNYNDTIECKNNRLVLFPSHYWHGVNKIEMNKNEDKGYGRYSISHFYYSKV